MSNELILVVDDDWMIREILQAHLQAAGYAVMVAASGDRALEMAAADPPDLVILDMRMHGLSGYDTCARLRASEATHDIPIVMMTAMEDEETRARALEAGADDFLSKPFDSLLVLTRVRSLLRIKHLQDELNRRETWIWQVLNHHLSEDSARQIMADLARGPG